MASSSSVNSLPSSAGFSHPLVARRLGVPPSRHPWIHLLVGGWSSSMALLIHGLLPPRFIWPSPAPSLSLLAFTLFCSAAVLCPVHFLGCRVVLLVSMPCCSLGCSCSSLGLLGASFSAHCCLCAVLLPPSSFLSAILPPMVCIPTFQCAPISFFLYGRLVDLPGFPALRLLGFHSSFLQVVSSCPSFGALLTRSNLRYTPRRGLPLGRVSFCLAYWLFILVPLPHGSPLLLWPFSSFHLGLALGFSWCLISCWVPSLSLRLLPVVFSACCVSLPCVLHLPLFWPSLGFLTTFLFFPPGASVESQFLCDGVLPPGRVSSVWVFVRSFPWFTSCPLLLVYSRLLLLFLFLFLWLSLSSWVFPATSFPFVLSRVLFPSCCCSPFCF